ncbi:MAG TPA: hypothetical protein VLZ77_06145 [Acidimicrobiales bacterium]|nr:hypothetical protein [Acidimicrobiales bacterium]
MTLPGIDLTLEGEAERVTDPGTLRDVAAAYRALGWPAVVDGEAFTAPCSAPSAGPPPWRLYRLGLRTAVGSSTEESHGATLWRFGP